MCLSLTVTLKSRALSSILIHWEGENPTRLDSAQGDAALEAACPPSERASERRRNCGACCKWRMSSEGAEHGT
jgi:hypothetical protein